MLILRPVLEQPLWLLPLALWLLFPRRRGWTLRSVALLALWLAAAGLSLGTPRSRLVYVVDRSDSIGELGLSLVRLVPGSEVGLVTFASRATIERLIGPGPLPDRSEAVLDGSSTNIAAGLGLAQALDPDHMVLISDGLETTGHVLAALPQVPVDVLPIQRHFPEVVVTALTVPRRADPGATVTLAAVVESNLATSAELQLFENHQLIASRPADLHPGVNSFLEQRVLSSGGAYYYQLRIIPHDDTFAQNNSAEAQVVVASAPQALVIGDTPLWPVLQAQGYTVEQAGPEAITGPLVADLVVIQASALVFTPEQLTLLRDYVATGGGLMMLGGPEGFGLGGWYDTPTEEALPVSSDLHTQVAFPSIALVLILDHSLSMIGGNKLELARDGAARVIELMNERDLVGVLVFSDQSEWIIPLDHPTPQSKLSMIEQVLAVQATGGTVLAPAMEQVFSDLRQVQARIKHVIILSDGQSLPGEFEALTREASAAGITVSSIAVGRDADQVLLENIANWGGGRFYAALRANDLPRLFVTEALVASRPLVVEEQTALAWSGSPLLDGVDLTSAPPLEGYIATTPAPNAEILASSAQGDPIIAVRRYGLGRSVAITTDFARLAPAWPSWPDFPALIGNLARWARRSPGGYTVFASAQGQQVQVTVDAVEGGEYVNLVQLTAHLGSNQVVLDQTAPGRYEGTLPLAEGEVIVEREGRAVGQAQVLRSYPAEYQPGNGELLLHQIAERTGGAVLESLSDLRPRTGLRTTPLWPYLAALALVLLVLELAYYRLRAWLTTEE